jgi:flagellar motor protein MotB
MALEGQITRQSTSYRQGLVLGLTMAEIMLLLIFCLLIALVAYIKFEHEKLQKAQEDLRSVSDRADADRKILDQIKQNPLLREKLNQSNASGRSAAIDEFWRELVESNAVISDLKKEGLTIKEIRDRVSEAKDFRQKGIDANKAQRDADYVGSIQRRFSAEISATSERVIAAIERGISGQGPKGHLWPPIIRLSESDGHFFESGRAELTEDFRRALSESVPARVATLIKDFDVDVIEVVGHTDDQPVGIRQSNLDRDLSTILKGEGNIASLTPADNAGLGLARAVSVVSVLRKSPQLQNYKIIPLSAAQIVNTDETLALEQNSGDVKERRRIEIRLRKSAGRDTVPGPPQGTSMPAPQNGTAPVPSPKQRPVQTAPRSIPTPAQRAFPKPIGAAN